jgi:hypothetical protein
MLENWEKKTQIRTKTILKSCESSIIVIVLISVSKITKISAEEEILSVLSCFFFERGEK